MTSYLLLGITFALISGIMNGIFTLPDFAEVIAHAPHRAVMLACVLGFAWGFGAIMFGQGISAVGISMANTLVLAISVSFGSVLCAYLLWKNRSWTKYGEPRAGNLYMRAILMGLLWGGNIFVYGFASPALGKLGPAIGWPLTLTIGLIIANVCGFWIGEWKFTQKNEQRWMVAGLVVLLVAIVTLGWSSTLG